MAQRTLTLHNGDERSTVLIRVWSPVRSRPGFVCDFAIDGLPPKAVRTHAAGGDSLQAVVLALQFLYLLLEPLRDRLSWPDERELGSTGIHYMVTHFLAPEQRRLERLVKDEAERSAVAFNANQPSTQRSARNRERYDPGAADADYAARSTPELIELLRAAAVRADAFAGNGNEDGWSVVYAQQTQMLCALLDRTDLEAALIDLAQPAREAERPLRYRAAELLLWQFGRRAELERLVAEAVKPEATKARRLLDVSGREARRPKPWDDELTTSEE
jgi:hypothetical protein